MTCKSSYRQPSYCQPGTPTKALDVEVGAIIRDPSQRPPDEVQVGEIRYPTKDTVALLCYLVKGSGTRRLVFWHDAFVEVKVGRP